MIRTKSPTPLFVPASAEACGAELCAAQEAAVLRELGETDLCFSYLASRLEEHYEDAHHAFSRILKLDEYAENPEAPGFSSSFRPVVG